MFVSLVYEVSLILLSLLALPKFLYDFFLKKKYRKNFFSKFGYGFPTIHKNQRPLIWVHAVSLGETKAIAPFVKKIKAEFSNSLILFSTATETGYEEGLKSVPADHHLYMPLDYGWIIRPIIKKIAPDYVFLCESDFWYNFLKVCKQEGAFVAIVNGKISSKSCLRFSKVPLFSKSLFSHVDLFCLQSDLYKKRFLSLGIPEGKMVVTGNIKFNGTETQMSEVELADWKLKLNVQKNDQVIVLGSTHHPEEVILLKVFEKIWPKFPNLKLLLVPRHPERFDEVATLLQKMHIPFQRYSQNGFFNEQTKVVLVDAMGVLRKCYQTATIAIVAGSYTERVGGHNILEPAWYGVPVLFGPFMHSQPDMVDLVKDSQAGLQVPSEELEAVIIKLLQDPEECQHMGQKGQKLISEMQGALGKTWEAVRKITK